MHAATNLFVHKNLFKIYLATAVNASSTLSPVLAEVSINGTRYSRDNLSPSSRFTARSAPQSDLLPIKLLKF